MARYFLVVLAMRDTLKHWVNLSDKSGKKGFIFHVDGSGLLRNISTLTSKDGGKRERVWGESADKEAPLMRRCTGHPSTLFAGKCCSNLLHTFQCSEGDSMPKGRGGGGGGLGVLRISSDEDDRSKDFWGFEIFDSRIFFGRKIWQVFFGGYSKQSKIRGSARVSRPRSSSSAAYKVQPMTTR